MGWMTRFEPATSGSTDRRSNQLSYIHHKSVLYYTNLLAALQNILGYGCSGLLLLCMFLGRV